MDFDTYIAWVDFLPVFRFLAHILEGVVLGVEAISGKDDLDQDHEEEKVIHKSLELQKKWEF